LICLAVLLGETYYLVTEDRLTIGALDAMWSPGLITINIVAFYGKYFLKALASTATLLIGLLIPIQPARMLKWRGLAVIPLVPFLMLSGLIYYVGAGGGRETIGMPSQFLTPGVFGVFAVSNSPSIEKMEVEIPLSDSSSPKHIVLIVDESVSGDFIDLNVPRGTTPFLVSQASSVANFGLVVSASNCSNASNAILRLGANPDTLGVGDNSILSNPSVWKYAKKAGFETSFIEAQYISEGHRNFMNRTELGLIDHVLTYSSDTDKIQRDARLVGQLSHILSRSESQFVYVNKYGSHFPYQNSYPESETVFQPAMQSYETIADRERLVNSYKNAIRWSVDRFFKTLLNEIDLSNSVLIYTSDHGQNLLDDGKPTTHCRRSHESLYEAVVPLLVWTGNKQIARKFGLAAIQNHNSASHFEIFPTILQLFGYDPRIVKQRYHQSLFEKIDEPLGFTSGPVMGRFGKQITWHSRAGLDRLDR
jgi:glucan phosphoethanolaminetransferase (alkaline phosphatase superfamily)